MRWVALAIWMIGFFAVTILDRFVTWKIKGKDDKDDKNTGVTSFFWIVTAVFFIEAIMRG